MMIFFHKKFTKRYKKLPEKIKTQFKNKLAIFSENPFDSRLNNHSLHGEWRSYRSIDVTGDVRAIYKVIDKNTIEFQIIDTHSELY